MLITRLLKIAALAVLPLMLGGCDIPSLGAFFDTNKSCSTGSALKQAACLTRNFRDICAAGGLGLRDSTKRLRKISNNDIGTRVCKKRIAITVGPIIDGKNVTGTLMEQTDRQATKCYERLGSERTLCDARVKLTFLSRQFKAACLAPIPWYTANDLMRKTVELRDQVIDKATIKGNHIYRANSKWICHKNASVSGLNRPRLKRVYAEPDNKLVLKMMAIAQNDCSSDPQRQTKDANSISISHNIHCVLPKALTSLGQKFASVCKDKITQIAKKKALGDLVHARKYLAILHPEHFRKSSFVWLCGKNRVFVKSRIVMMTPETALTSAEATALKKPFITNSLAKPRKMRKNMRWKTKKSRARIARLKRLRRAKSKKSKRRASWRKQNQFSFHNAAY